MIDLDRLESWKEIERRLNQHQRLKEAHAKFPKDATMFSLTLGPKALNEFESFIKAIELAANLDLLELKDNPPVIEIEQTDLEEIFKNA